MTILNYKSFFQFIFPTRKTSNEQTEIAENVQSLIDNGNSPLLSVCVANNYTFSFKHVAQIIFPEKKQERISFAPDVNERFYSHNWKEVHKLMKIQLAHFKKAFDNNEIIISSSFLTTKTESYNTCKDYVKTLHLLCKTENKKFYADNLNELTEMYELTRQHQKMMNEIARTQRGSESVVEITSAQSMAMKYFTDLYTEVFTPVFKTLAHRSNVLAMDNIKDNMTQEITDNIKLFNIEQLPAHCQKILVNINENYSLLIANEDKLNLTQKLDCSNLYTKRVPQVINEYITIPDKYRSRLNEAMDSPDKLVHESLQEIDTKLQNILDSVQENNLNDMKKTKQYLKNIA